jgi:hypothetical protein
MSKIIFIALILFSSQAFSASQGEVCTEREWTELAAWTERGMDNTKVYNCPSLGNLTIPQIYQKGWRVVLTEVAAKHEKDMSKSYVKGRLLIEKIP